jgi:neutral ceramidase
LALRENPLNIIDGANQKGSFMRLVLLCFLLFMSGCQYEAPNSNLAQADLVDFELGVGKADITGPAAGLATMGYAAPTPKTAGIQQRLWARAFYFSNQAGKEFVYVVADLCFVTQAIKLQVAEAISEKTGGRIGIENIMISATHTHSAPGATSHHRYFNIPSRGFSIENFEIVTRGIVKAIEQSIDAKQTGEVSVATGTLEGAGINRSLLAYLENPEHERAAYNSTTDTATTLIQLADKTGEAIGFIHFFAVHATTIEKDNGLISGDNKGYAAQRMEQTFAENGQTVVAAFANSAAGDVSPNIAKDQDGDGDWDCIAPDNFDCAKESGEKQFMSAMDLILRLRPLKGSRIDYRHKFYDFSSIKVRSEFTGMDKGVKTCSAGIGISMLAGSAEDGPGVGREGVHCKNAGILAKRLCGIFAARCHGRKPVVLRTGNFSPPMTPQVLPNQLVLIGDLAFAAVPAEFTTMSGRRLRADLEKSLDQAGVGRAILVGYANAYSQYVATREEYQQQYYEGASTVFGEHTLAAYRQNFAELAAALVNDIAVKSLSMPYRAIDMNNQASVEAGEDRIDGSIEFGNIREDAKEAYRRGETVNLTYDCSLPNHNMRIGGSFLHVERRDAGEWAQVYNDDHWSTKFNWSRARRGRSICRIDWQIAEDEDEGQYRIVVYGDALQKGELNAYRSLSRSFQVVK